MTLIYLATPMDQADELDDADRAYMGAALVAAGFSVYDPHAAWRGSPSPQAGRVNDVALESCDGLLALLLDGVPTVGVPMEIERVAARGAPVAVVAGEKVATSPVLRALEGVAVFSTGLGVGVDDAVEWLTRPQGEAAREADRWEPFLAAVAAEVERAALKFPASDANTVEDWFGIWAEEVVEAMQAYNDWRRGQDLIASGGSGGGAPTAVAVQMELAQAAAMGCRLWAALGEEQ